MFTGIVLRRGVVAAKELSGEHGHLVVEAEPFDREIHIGDSIAVSGVCLTVTEQEGNKLHFDVLAETFHRTNLALRQPGDPINLEPALRYGDPLGGHIVNGHVDGVGTVLSVDQADDRDWVLGIETPEGLLEHLVEKGSIAINGVSLTVVDILPNGFTVHIIPHTLEVTSFSTLDVGDLVNLEADILSKYVRHALRTQQPLSNLDWETLQNPNLE